MAAWFNEKEPIGRGLPNIDCECDAGPPMRSSSLRLALRPFKMSTASKVSRPAQERIDEILESLVEIRSRVQAAASSSSSPGSQTLVAVSKYKPSGDILVCHENGQLDFGENYVQELVDKAQEVS